MKVTFSCRYWKMLVCGFAFVFLYVFKKVKVVFLCLSRRVSVCLRKEKFACGLEFGTKGERLGKSVCKSDEMS